MGTKKINRRGNPNKSDPPSSSRQVTTRQGRRVIKQRYLLRKELGQGGMGQTFLAQDTHFGDMCVVKMVTGDPQLIQREARRLCYLKHEGIPAYRDFILESSTRREDEAFLVQEYVQGKTLREATEEHGGRLPLSQCHQLLQQALEILHYLHTRKDPETQETAPVLHLDIKPDNIIIRDSDQQLFLIDFGLSAQAHISLFISQGVTPSIQGYSPGYSPYEQTQGRVVPASDLYALGMTILVILTGKDVREVRYLLDQNRLFHAAHCPKLPSDVEAFLRSMVTLRLEDRIPSAAVALRRLKRIRSRTWKRHLLWLLPLLGAAGGAYYLYQRWF